MFLLKVMIKLVNGSLVCHLITSAVIYFEKKEIPLWKWSLSMEPSGGLFGLIHGEVHQVYY